MNCSQARKVLYPEPAKCAVTIQHEEAMEHVRGCAACEAYFHDQAEWSRLLKEKAGVERAPESLSRFISRSILFEPKQQLGNRQRDRRLFLAALAALFVLSGLWFAFRAPSESFFRHLCKDHARYLDAQAEVQSSEPRVLESWFRGKTTFATHVPVLERAELVGGRLCFLRDKQAALIFYRLRDRPVSLFQFSKQGVSLRALDRSVLDGAPIWHGSFDGYNVAAFDRRGMIYAMVSDLRESELLELASAAQIKARGY